MGSPACKLGVVVEGGSVKIVIMSFTACLKKSSIFTFGKGMAVGKKITMSTYRSILVLGNYRVRHM